MKTAILVSGLVSGILAGLTGPLQAVAGEPIGLEAEPKEAFKVCDMYGPGFVYIPGTETCIKISGSIRTTYTLSDGKSFKPPEEK